MNVSHLIASYGYWAVFVLVGAESLGIPLPGETALITAGIYVGSRQELAPSPIQRTRPNPRPYLVLQRPSPSRRSGPRQCS